MYSTAERAVKNNLAMDGDGFVSIEERHSSDKVADELSLSEHVFTKLQIYSDGFKLSFFTNEDLANLSLTFKTLGLVYSLF